MPFKTDKIAIDTPFFDRRTKIIPCQRQMIPVWWANGASIHSLAKMFKVDRRVIQFILFPERQKKNIKDRKLRGGWVQYYDKQYHADKQREHRQYKYKLLKNSI